MSACFDLQDKVVVDALLKYNNKKRREAIEMWMSSKTRNLIQCKYKMEHISGARCYDELMMELNNDPYWMKGQFI